MKKCRKRLYIVVTNIHHALFRLHVFLCLPQLYLTNLKHVVSFPVILLCRFESVNGFNNRAVFRLQNDEKRQLAK